MSTIAPNDANILYSPYTWLVGATAKTINAGAYLKIMFTGTPTALSATFDVSNMPTSKSRVGFRIDGGSWQDSDVAASVSLTMPTGNTWAVHTLEMVVICSTETATRWTAPQNTAVILTGIVADVALTTRAVRPRTLTGLCLGDSITEGVRTLNMTAVTDPYRNDSRLAWAYPLADILGAEIGVVGFGATGITRSGSGGVPQFCDSAPWLWNGQARSLAVQPDFIVAHIGTNDSAATDASVTANTAALLNPWLAAAAARVFVLAGWKQIKKSAITAGVAACSTPSRVTFVDTTGWWNAADTSDATHPYGYVNIMDLAPRLAVVIRAALAAPPPPGRRFICNAAGIPIPLS